MHFLKWVFQEDGITISRVQDNLTALLAKLESFKVRPGQQLNSFLTEVGDGNTFKGIELQRDADRQSVNAIQASAVNAAMTFIQERFERMETDPVLSAAAVLTNHRGWPVADRHRLLLHGENEIQTLRGHFQAPLEQHNFSLNDCLDEWMSLKFHVQRVSRTWTQAKRILEEQIYALQRWLSKPTNFSRTLSCNSLPDCLLRAGELLHEQNHDWLEVNLGCFYYWWIDENSYQWTFSWGLYCGSCSWALAGGVRTEQTAYIEGLIIAFNDHFLPFGKN